MTVRRQAIDLTFGTAVESRLEKGENKEAIRIRRQRVGRIILETPQLSSNFIRIL